MSWIQEHSSDLVFLYTKEICTVVTVINVISVLSVLIKFDQCHVTRALLSEVKTWIPLSSSQATHTIVALELACHEIVTVVS